MFCSFCKAWLRLQELVSLWDGLLFFFGIGTRVIGMFPFYAVGLHNLIKSLVAL